MENCILTRVQAYYSIQIYNNINLRNFKKCIHMTWIIPCALNVTTHKLYKIKNFNFRWSEGETTSKQCLCIARSITVARRRTVCVTKVCVRICWTTSIVCNIDIITSSKGWTITRVCVYRIMIVSIDISFEWLYVVFVS